MNQGKLEIRRFVMEIKESGMITPGGSVLEIGTGNNRDNFVIMHDRYKFTPTDWIIMDGVPGVAWLDAHNFAASPVIEKQKEWDAILACQVLEHCKFPGLVCRQVLAHLKRGGIFVVTLPFSYGIHESDPERPEITETDMSDYWRFTPSGLSLLFASTGFVEFYVSARYRQGDDKWNPSFVMGWARKASEPGEKTKIYREWHCGLPENWEQEQLELERKFERRYLRG